MRSTQVIDISNKEEAITKLNEEIVRLNMDYQKTCSEMEESKTLLTFGKIELNSLRENLNSVKTNFEALKQAADSNNKYLSMVHRFRDMSRSSLYLSSTLKQVVAKMPPTGSDQVVEQQKRDEHYNKCLKVYENKKSYQKLIELEVNIKELTELILERNNEFMKIETSQQF